MRFVLGNLAIYGRTVIVIVGEGIMDCWKGQMRIVLKQFFGSQSMQQDSHNHGSDRDSCLGQTWTASAGVGIADDMGMGDLHAASVADFYLSFQ